MTPNTQSTQNEKPTVTDHIKFYSLTALIALGIIICYYAGMPTYYLGWIAFTVAAFSVAGNDAIQTIGTFIESKRSVPWLPKAIVFCGLLFITHYIAWTKDSGEIHFHRLDSFDEPVEFNLLQLLAPIVLVVITRLRAPISTTFLILGLFGGSNIEKMLTKSFLGYGIAFGSAIVVWAILPFVNKDEYKEDYIPSEKSEKIWSFLQWISTSFLWMAWLLQDTANIAVFIPRKLSFVEFFFAISLISFALILIIRSNGGTIQDVVSEKSDVTHSKAATLIDIVYALVLLVFQYASKVPMSTTWVFLGLLAGREIVLHIVTRQDRPYLETFRTIGKDVILATLGIAISLFIYAMSYTIYPSEKNQINFNLFKKDMVQVYYNH